MHIGLLVPNLQIGGAERAFVFLANVWARAGHQVDLVVLDGAGPLRSQIDDRVRIVELGAAGMLTGLPRLRTYLRRSRPAALIATLTHANIVAVWARHLAGGNVPLIVREATTLSRNRGTGVKREVIRRLAGAAYRAADRVIAVSDGVADDLVESFGVPRRSIRVIDNPALPLDLQQSMEAPVDHPWLGGDEPVILSVGRFTEAKDYPTLIRAFGEIVKERAARLIVLGDGELRGAIESQVRELGLEDRVALPGFVDNPFAWMSRASLFVLSSQYEGMPNVLIQALACGCPVVSTDCPNGPREVLDGGRFGSLVPVGDASALAGAALAVLDGRFRADDPTEQVARYSPDRIGRAYLAAVLEVRGESDRA